MASGLITTDAIVVGGGPAGSTCAWKLKRAGMDCLVLDRETFPRTKLCAGWITPEVVADLEMDPGTYPHGFLTFPGLKIHVFGLTFTLDSPEHSIRRREFDHWLLERSGAEVADHYVQDIRREDGFYVIDDTYRCTYLVGAGGTRCPVYRTLFADAHPRGKELRVVALEREFPFQWRDGDCHLWFFQGGLPGYSWYVPKAGGHLNVGVGGSALGIKQRRDTIKNHWGAFTRALDSGGLVDGVDLGADGFSYYLRGDRDIPRVDNAFVIGDAAGLATRDLCEGIGPAVQSGLRAAASIVHGAPYTLTGVPRYSAANKLVRRLIEYKIVGRRRAVS